MIKKLASMLLVVCLLLLTACDNNNESKGIIDIGKLGKLEDNIGYTTEKVAIGDIIEDLEVKLMISNRCNREIVFDHDVIVKEVHVKNDVAIPKGTLILELDSTKIDREIEDIRFLLEEEKKFYNQMKKLGYSSKEIQIQEIEVNIVEKKLASLIKKKEGYKIYAKRDCVIIYGNLKKGNKYVKGQALLKLAESTDYIIKTPRDSKITKFNNVDVGDELILKKRFGKKECVARVSYINRKNDGKGEIFFEDVSNMIFFSTGKVAKEVNGKFKSVIIKNALSVNKNAIRYGDKAYVETIKDGKRRVRYVTMGAFGENEKGDKVVEILSGLKEGETVITKKTYKADTEVFKNLNSK